jgi:acid phosphatase type 7
MGILNTEVMMGITQMACKKMRLVLAATIGIGAMLLGCSRAAPSSPALAPPAGLAQEATSTPPAPIVTETPPAALATLSPNVPSDPIVFFTGDLVSGSSVSRAKKVVALIQGLMDQHVGTKMLVASTGDNEQENNPTLSDYQNYFGATYGVFVSQGIFMPVRGNHDVQDLGHGAAYAAYFGDKTLLNYSYDLGTWHIVGLDQLNGNVNRTALEFLISDLATHTKSKCQLVYWHVPTFSSGISHGDALGLKPLNQAEYEMGVDIQINGHDHNYQRFNPLNPDGLQDDAKGITTFIDGIGGQDGRTRSKTSIAQAASALYLDTFPGGDGDHAIGVIMFTLHSTSADYALYDANNGEILDHGTVNCH